MTIAIRLKQAMFDEDSKTRFSQSELSRRSNVPQPTINRILNGQILTEPETATVEALARACNVSFEWLRTGEGPRSRTHDSGAAREHLLRPKGPTGLSPAPAPRFQRHWLPDDEAELLAEIRSLTPNSQKRLRSIIMGMKRDDVILDTVDKR